MVRHTCTLGHLLVGRGDTLLLYGFDEIVQRLVQVQPSCMLDLFGDGRPVNVVQNRSLDKSCQSYGKMARMKVVEWFPAFSV